MTGSASQLRIRLALITVLILAVYGNCFQHQFVWDDIEVIVDNPLLESFRSLPALFLQEDAIGTTTGYYRPLTYLSFLVDRSLWGLNPLGFNLTNIVLHVAVSCALYLLLRELFKKERFALLAALIFALHPIANETINFHAGGRNTLLCALFALLTVLFHARGSFAAALACFALAIFSKEFALLIPGVLLFYDSGLSDRKLPLQTYLLYLLVIIGYLTLRSFAVASPNFLNQLNLHNLLLLSPKLVVNYWLNLIYPPGLQTMYDLRAAERVRQTMPQLLMILGAVGATIYFRKNRVILFAAGWFFLFLLPVSGIFPTGLTAMADRYVYFSSMGFAMVLAYLISLADGKAALAVMVVLCTFYAAVDLQRNSFWKSQLSLFTQMAKDVPQLGIGYQNLGYGYYDQGDIDNAVKNLSIACTKTGLNSEMMIGSASIFWEAKRYDQAIIVLNKKIQFEPGDPLSYIMLSRVYGEMGDKERQKIYRDKAEQLFPQVEEMMSQRVDSLCRQTDELLEKRNLAGAERLMKEAQKIDPNAVPVLVDLAILSAEKRQLPKALQYLTRALSLEPDHPPVHYNLAIVYRMLGKKAEAEAAMLKFKETEALAVAQGKKSAQK